MRLITGLVLAEAGFEVVPVENATEGLAVLKEAAVDALVTDIEMPGGVDGLALARAARELRPDLGILIVSGRIAPRRDDLPPGARFAPKPCDPDRLVDFLRGVLARTQAA